MSKRTVCQPSQSRALLPHSNQRHFSQVLPLTTIRCSCLSSKKATTIRADQCSHRAFLTSLFLHHKCRGVLPDSDLCCGEIKCVSAAKNF